MNVVLDTNVWLSAVFWKGEAHHLIETIRKKDINITITRKILDEIVDVLNKEAKFQRFIKDKNASTKDLIRTILSFCTLAPSSTTLSIVTDDPSDNRIIESAIDGNAEYIISYDNHLLKLKEYKSIKIITPQEFLRLQKE